MEKDLQGAVDEIKKKLDMILTEIGGAEDPQYRNPDRKSIRVRLHDLEQGKYAASAVWVALGMIFGRVGKLIVIGGIIIGTSITILTFLGVGGR